jgi:hypothetical protein
VCVCLGGGAGGGPRPPATEEAIHRDYFVLS